MKPTRWELDDLKGGEVVSAAGVGQAGAEGDRLEELFLGQGL